MRSWQTAYRGIMPDSLLAVQNATEREAKWRETLAKMSGQMLVAVDPDDQLVGFTYLARAQDLPEDRPYDGRVYALHVRPDRKRQGIGSQLHRAALLMLDEMGCRSAIIWTLEDLAPSRRFYEKRGGALVRSKLGDFGGMKIVEVAYGWEDLANAN